MDSNFLLTAGGTALVSSLLIQYIKKSELTLFNAFGIEDSKSKANLTLSIIFAFFTSIGIGFKYDGTSGVLIVNGLTTAGILHGVWHWFIQWTSQHLLYKQVIVPTELQAAIVNTLKQIVVQLGEKAK